MGAVLTLQVLRPRLLLGLAVAAFALALLSSFWGRPSGRLQNESSAPASDVVAATSGVIAFWSERVARDPYDYVGYNKLADGYLRRARQTGDVADYTRAEAALRASLGVISERNFEAQVALAHVLVSKHEFAQAEAMAQALTQRVPDEPFPWGVLGDAQMARGNYEAADRSYRTMLGLQPSAGAFTRMAYLAEARGRLDDAELNFRNAFSLDGGSRPETSAGLRTEAGNFYLARSRTADAERAYRTALEALPGYVPALAGLAAVAAARGDDAAAIEGYTSVLPRNPQPEYVIALGDLHMRAGNAREAERQYALVRAIGQLYEANGIRSDLTLLLFEADHGGDPATVLERARAAYAERPSLAAADVYAWALYRNGRFEEARQYSDEALRLGTQDALYYFHAGMIADRLGDREVARGHLQRALDINPRFHILHAPEARAALERLGGMR